MHITVCGILGIEWMAVLLNLIENSKALFKIVKFLTFRTWLYPSSVKIKSKTVMLLKSSCNAFDELLLLKIFT